MAHPKAAACAAQTTPLDRPLIVLRAIDALDMLQRPLKALQGVEQLTHLEELAQTHFVGVPLVERECLGYLLTVINLDFARVVEDLRATLQQGE